MDEQDDMSVCSHSATCWIWSVRRSFWLITTSAISRRSIRSTNIVEIIDHHRIDSVETSGPIYFRNQPLGCTATIITQMYHEHNVEIEPKIAGLLCSAILSDTLMFRSPTCTPLDRMAAEELAKIAGLDIKQYATEMFRSSSRLLDRSMDELFHMDFKYFRYRIKNRHLRRSRVSARMS